MELQEIWKPVGLVLSVISAFAGIKEFHHQTGPFIYIGSALLALAVAILFTIPKESIHILAKRLVAFAIDLVLLSVFTIGATFLLFKFQIVRASAIVSAGVVWTWVLYFVILEWRFEGTPGMHILRLRLTASGNENITLLKCVARNLLLLVVPVIASGNILKALWLSRLGAFAKWSVGISILSLIPLSIAFCGGQSFPDLLLRIAVRPRRATSRDAARCSKLRTLMTVVATLVTGAIFGLASSTAYGRFTLGRAPPIPSLTEFRTSGPTEAQVAEALRAHLNGGILAPDVFSTDTYLQELRVFSAAGTLPSITEDTALPAACQNLRSGQKRYQIVRAQISPETPTLVELVLMGDLAKNASLYAKRPSFLVLEILHRRSLGIFNMEGSEHYTYCLTDSEGDPVDSMVNVQGSIGFMSSLSEIAILMLGDLDTYSKMEKLPIWLH